MSYYPLGIDWGTVSSALTAGTKVLQDPYLSQLTCEVLRLAKAQKGENPGPPCARTAAAPGGVGLNVAILPVKALTYQKQHPWFLPVVGVGVVGVFVLIGYAIGRGSK